MRVSVEVHGVESEERTRTKVDLFSNLIPTHVTKNLRRHFPSISANLRILNLSIISFILSGSVLFAQFALQKKPSRVLRPH